MEFYIKKNATLPLLKMQVVKDGRSDYNKFMQLLEESSIFFSMVDIETGIQKIQNRPAGLVNKTFIDPNAEPEYYIFYQFSNFETKKPGRYEGQFIIINNEGTLILPIRDRLFINIQESFICDDLSYDNNCYVVEYPCCNTKPVGPVTTTTTTICYVPPITTTTTTIPPTTTTTTTSPFVEQFAYLFIEPVTGSTNIGEWMFNNGSNFFGFTNNSQPTQNQSTFNFDLNTYVNFTGWTNGLFPQIITQTVPQVSGGIDSFGNSIVAFNFTTTRVLEGTVPVNSWYTWIIPISATNNQRQVAIDINSDGNPNILTSVSTENTINSYTFTYSGSTIPQTTYKVYTTYPSQIFKLNNTKSIYFRGNEIEP